MLLAVAAAAVTALVVGVLLVLVIDSRPWEVPRTTPVPRPVRDDNPTGRSKEDYDREAAQKCGCPYVNQPVCQTPTAEEVYTREYISACMARCNGATRWDDGTCPPVVAMRCLAADC